MDIMRILYIIFLAAITSCTLLWLGAFGKLRKLYAAIATGLVLALTGVFLLLAVLPTNSFYGPVLAQGNTQKKVIALTFDDGPYPPYTQKLLQVLREKNVHATFFMVGENAAHHPELVKEVQKDNHEIALHAGYHRDLLKLDPGEVRSNIAYGKQILKTLTGKEPLYMRPPHGFKDWSVLAGLAEHNLQAVNWSIIPRDWTNPGAKQIAKRVLDNAAPGAIVLLHDGDSPAQTAPRDQTIEATAIIIDELRKQGYEFVTVSELIKE